MTLAHTSELDSPIDLVAATPVPPAAHVPQPTCPNCHTTDRTVCSVTLQGGATWSCVQCGTTWSARRLAAMAAYAEWSGARQAASGLGVTGSPAF